jgi:hypothetical protein
MILVARSMRPVVRQILVVFAAALAGFGCSSTCDTSDPGNPPVWYEGGTAVNGVYASSSAHGDLLHFPAGRRYDLVHHLGFPPIQVQLYWSFAEAGIGWDTQSEDKSSLTLASGNSAVILLKNDRFIRVKNDSCVEFWLLAVASGDPRPRDAGAMADVSVD